MEIQMAYKEGKIARNQGKSREENPYVDDGSDEMGAKRLDWFDGWDDADREYCSGTRTTGY